MSRIDAVVVNPNAPAHLALGKAPEPSPGRSEAVVRVAAISLNRGEVRAAQTAVPGHRPGWDLAGTVEQAATDGSGPRTGTRVVGFLPSGAWAERVAVPVRSLAELPDTVSFAQAATLPVAGLTALYALEKPAGGLLGRNVLVTGASGGAGHFAMQLAHAAGARVVGVIRQARGAHMVKEAGADEVVVSDDAAAAAAHGPYNLIAESVGGAVLANALTMLAPGGTCVTFGASAAPEVTFDVCEFFRAGGRSLYGLILFYELDREPAGIGLGRLARLIAGGVVRPHISVEGSWTRIGEIAQQLLDRRYTGKAVLHVAD